MTQDLYGSSFFRLRFEDVPPIDGYHRGTHYGIFRVPTSYDVLRRPVAIPHLQDFAVIWDRFREPYVVSFAERLYLAGLLSPVQFIGHRRGVITVIVAAKSYYSGIEVDSVSYIDLVRDLAREFDPGFSVVIGTFDRHEGSAQNSQLHILMADTEQRSLERLREIDRQWRLGTYNSETVMAFDKLLGESNSRLDPLPHSLRP